MATSDPFQYPSGPKVPAAPNTPAEQPLPTQKFTADDANLLAQEFTAQRIRLAALEATLLPVPAAPAVVGVTSSAVQFTLPAGVTLDQLEVSITPVS